MKTILFITLLVVGCPMTQEEKKAHVQKGLKNCFVYKNNCFCYMTSTTHMGYEVYSPTWAPMEVCE